MATTSEDKVATPDESGQSVRPDLPRVDRVDPDFMARAYDTYTDLREQGRVVRVWIGEEKPEAEPGRCVRRIEPQRTFVRGASRLRVFHLLREPAGFERGFGLVGVGGGTFHLAKERCGTHVVA